MQERVKAICHSPRASVWRSDLNIKIQVIPLRSYTQCKRRYKLILIVRSDGEGLFIYLFWAIYSGTGIYLFKWSHALYFCFNRHKLSFLFI